jgi:hypothetical protein
MGHFIKKNGILTISRNKKKKLDQYSGCFFAIEKPGYRFLSLYLPFFFCKVAQISKFIIQVLVILFTKNIM